MVGLINYHFSNGMLSLFIDTSYDQQDMSKNFRSQFLTYEEMWNVRDLLLLFVKYKTLELVNIIRANL